MNKVLNKIKDLELEIKQNIKSSKSHNTIRAYKSDLKSFNQFCKNLNLSCMPTNEKAVSLFITEISKFSKFSTIKRKLAAIKTSHVLTGNYLDLKHPIINENLKSIKNKIGIYQKSKKPILIKDLKQIISNVELQTNIKTKLRDKALILVGFAGAFRRSELVSLKFKHLDFVNEGVKIFIERSKTDQSGEGMVKALPFFNDRKYCPVLNLQIWINFLKNKNTKSEKIFNISDKSVALIVKKYVKASGLDDTNYAGHSLRSGFATSTAESGAEERQIMAMTGHKSNLMVRRYIQEANLFKNNALNKINFN